MCVAFVLLMNSFYKVYYWLFDLCEHVVAMLLLLGALCLIFTPILFSVNPSEEQRPLFTIVILVTGVVGGLVIVITVVYFYRFCLRKRSPVTTTGKPELKREQVRSLVQSQCRPLPIPSLIPQADHNPLYQHFMPQSHHATKPTILEKSVLLDLASDTSKIAQVFPLMTRKTSPPLENPSFAKILEQQRSATQPIVQISTATIDFAESEAVDAARKHSSLKPQPQKASSQQSSTHFLNVEQATPYRARSAEFLSPSSKAGDDDDPRRASFDGTGGGGRRPGTGRQLPSTDHLKVRNKTAFCYYYPIAQYSSCLRNGLRTSNLVHMAI